MSWLTIYPQFHNPIHNVQERDRCVEELQAEVQDKDDQIHLLQNQLAAKDEDLRRQLGVSDCELDLGI